jgi:arylsulfatase A-like enzyme
MDQGFDEFFGFTNATHAWEKFPTELWDGRGKVLVDGHADDLFAAKSVDFIHQTGQESGPFFLYLPFISAHFDIEAPADEVAKHAERFEEIDRALPLRATYAAMITRFDANVGRVLGALDAQGVAGNTLVIFTSDHGATFESGNQGTSSFHDSNSPFRGQKRTLWEGGIRVPACARWPGKIPAGSERVEPMHMTDVFPTILAAAGVAPEASLALDGINLTPAWTGEASVPERSLFWEWQTEGYNQLAAMRGTHKLVITGGGKPELYDVVADPGERRDLSAQFPDDVKSLRSELHQWLATGT